jgi:hypothetical protein
MGEGTEKGAIDTTNEVVDDKGDESGEEKLLVGIRLGDVGMELGRVS